QEGVNETIDSMYRLEDSLTNLQNMDKDSPYYDAIMEETLNQLREGLDGAGQKQEDFKRLVAGANEVRDGLAEGSEFNAGLNSLDGGLGDLESGANELCAGLNEFDACFN